jgi:hypothetical protein
VCGNANEGPPNRYLIPTQPCFIPLLIAIEILSPDDRLSEVREKPRNTAHGECREPGLTETSSLTVPELGIEITPRDLFKSFK